MVTEPPWTKTPPPCKQRAERESTMRAMGFCKRGWHVLVAGRTKDPSKLKDESRFGQVSWASPRVGKFEVLCRTYFLYSLTKASAQLCKQESRQALQQFSHRGDGHVAGKFGTYPIRALAVEEDWIPKKAKFEVEMSARHFPIAAMRSFQGLCAARTHCR